MGTSSTPTLTLHGVIHSSKVLVLIDSRSTHNFVADDLVQEAKLTTHNVAPFGMRIGNGDILRCDQICKDVVLQINGLQIIQDFCPFSLEGRGDNVVLGIQWLATVNTVQANWGKRFMEFTVNGHKHKLQGLQPEAHNSATCHHLSIKPFEEQLITGTDSFFLNRLEDKSSYQAGSNDKNQIGRIIRIPN